MGFARFENQAFLIVQVTIKNRAVVERKKKKIRRSNSPR